MEIAVLILDISTLFAILVSTSYQSFIVRRNQFRELLALFSTVVFVNLFFILFGLYPYIRTMITYPSDATIIIWPDFLYNAVIYAVKWGIPISLYVFVQYLFGKPVTKSFYRFAGYTMLILILILLFSLIEIPVWGTNVILRRIFTLTDFLLFPAGVAAGIYLFYRAASLSDISEVKAVQYLGIVLASPFAIGILLMFFTPYLNKISDKLWLIIKDLVLILFNCAASWWMLKYSSIFRNRLAIVQKNKTSLLQDFVTKYKISNREMEVIDLICHGKTNNEIAKQLYISIGTVKDHNYNIFQKLNVKNRTQLAKLYHDYMAKHN